MGGEGSSSTITGSGDDSDETDCNVDCGSGRYDYESSDASDCIRSNLSLAKSQKRELKARLIKKSVHKNGNKIEDNSICPSDGSKSDDAEC